MGIQQIILYGRQVFPTNETMNVFYAGNLESDYSSGETAANDLLALLQTHLAPVLDINYQFYAFSVREVSVAGLPAITTTLTSTVDGEVAGGPLPTQTAWFVNFKSNTAAPRKSPKWFSGLCEARLSNGLLDTTFMNAANAFAAAVISANGIADADRKLCCVRWDPTEKRVVGANVIEAYTTTTVPRTQRRRTLGVGY